MKNPCRLLRAGLATMLSGVIAIMLTTNAATKSALSQDNAVESSGGVVASISAYASQVGIDVLDGGGNAMDAAVATVFAVGVTRPDQCGIGGGGFLVYRSNRGEVGALDFRETAPRAIKEGMTFESGIQTRRWGHTLVGVPGTVAGMVAARDRFGTRPLSELIAPAARLADDGFNVTSELALFTFLFATADPKLLYFPAAGSIYLPGNLAFGADSQSRFTFREAKLYQKEYARSLRFIAAYGRDAFYSDRADFPDPDLQYVPGATRPSIGRLIEADMRLARNAAGDGDEGLMSMDDIAAYEVIWRQPLVAKYRGREVIAMPPPTSGGIATLEILNIIENYDVASFGHLSADHLHVLAEAQKIAWADRERFVGDPDFVTVPSDLLTSQSYATTRSAEISMAEARQYGPAGSGGGTHTTHVSVIDADGNAVAVTCTLNDPFGSGVVAPGTGFLLNNQLVDFSGPTLDTGEDHPNRAEPGKRPRSSMSPTIVVNGGKPVLVLGGGGYHLIIMGVVQTIVNALDFGMDVASSVDAPRVQARPNLTPAYVGEDDPRYILSLEDGRIEDDTERVLADERKHILRSGHPGTRCRPATLGETLRIERGGPKTYCDTPNIQAVASSPSGNTKVAAWEPRGEGSPCGQDTGPCKLKCSKVEPSEEEPVPVANFCVQPPPR